MLGQYDVREDPEQKAKCDETMELLLAAGYFRVRIKGLSDFEKIIGGLAWSIQACNFAVDIDVLYQENAILGQKIALTERIVLVLSRMKCPHAIEPFQIQGGDFIHIFPVVQWLVKEVFKRRAEIGDVNRAYALNQYEKRFSLSDDQTVDASFKQEIQEIRIRHRPRRRFRCLEKRKKKLINLDERRRRIQLTLVEFGQTHQLLDPTATDEKPQQEVDALVKNMVNDKSKIANQIVSSLVNQQQDTLRGIIEDFEEKEKARLEEALQSESGQQLMALRTYKAQLKKQTDIINNLKNLIEQMQQKRDEANNAALQVKQEFDALKSELDEIENQLKNVDPEALKRVEALVSEFETLKKEENQRRLELKDETRKLENEIEGMEARVQVSIEDDPAESERYKKIQEQHEMISHRLQKQRLNLAKKVREISVLSRQLDDIPTSNEQAQYRQAIFQFYNQIFDLYRQTKQNFTLYNTLTDMINYMEKEIVLLESINTAYPQAIQSSSTKEQFLKQMEFIVESCKQSREKIERRHQEEKSKRDTLQIRYSQLIDKARQYAKVLKDFQEAISENEALTSN